MSKHTLQLLRHLCNNIPPLYPEELADKIKQQLNEHECCNVVDTEKLERDMVEHGFSVWPFHSAHKEFMKSAVDDMGDHFLEPSFDENLLNKYNDFKGYGGNWHELYSGRAADFFNHDERAQIARGMVEAKSKLQQYVEQDVRGMGKDKYLQRVEKYNGIIEEIKKELGELEIMAEKEEHGALVEQIRAKIEEIEHSFAHLGRHLDHHEIFNAVDFFVGRKNKLSRLRGIDTPKEVSLYDEE